MSELLEAAKSAVEMFWHHRVVTDMSPSDREELEAIDSRLRAAVTAITGEVYGPEGWASVHQGPAGEEG